MEEPIRQLEISLASNLSEARKVEKFIDDLIDEFGLPRHLYGKVGLCIVEATNNSLLYGNKLNPEKMITITAKQYINKISVTVEDEGEGFDYRHVPDPTTPENIMKATGRGLYLMSSLTDELLFHLNGRKVIMSFFLNKQNL